MDDVQERTWMVFQPQGEAAASNTHFPRRLHDGANTSLPSLHMLRNTARREEAPNLGIAQELALSR
jgi:hypothetical protein